MRRDFLKAKVKGQKAKVRNRCAIAGMGSAGW